MRRASHERASWLAKNVLPHEPSLRAWLAGRRLAGVDLDDVVQETYAILAGLESVAGIVNPRTYAFSVANSVVMTQFRRARVVSITAVENIERLGRESDAPSPETEASDREELMRLAGAVARLPDRCRQVFILRKIEGLSQREIAQRLGVSEGTIEKHLHRGLRILMDALGRGGKSLRQTSSAKHEPSQRDETGHGTAGDARRDR